jgi:hypothetical protein
MITDLITSGAMHSLKSVFQKKKERNVIIDPFSCLVKLSLIRYLEEGTKVSIYQNRLNFNAPSYMQGIVRFMYGDNREDLHNILLPIQKCVEWYWNDKNPDITYMFNNSVLGLKFLKNSYSTYATIQHTLDYYIIILMQRNTTLMTRMGINNIDIERLTNAILEGDSCSVAPSIALGNNTLNNNTLNTIASSKDKKELETNVLQSSTNNKKNKKQDQVTMVSIVTNAPAPSDDVSKVNEINKIEDNQQIKEPEMKHLQFRDIHKFLFELWNDREIGIVINLYREMESKSAGTERNYIYNNIMQYCEMKENKLYKYIEQNSSIL